MWGVCVCVCVCVCIGVEMVGWLGCVRRVGMYWKEGEEKLHHYIIFVTLSSLVHEKFYPINLIKMTKIENKNCKCSK